MNSLFISIGGIVGMMVIWIAIQSHWKKAFADFYEEKDALAGRSTCGNCGCSVVCQRKNKK